MAVDFERIGRAMRYRMAIMALIPRWDAPERHFRPRYGLDP